MKKDILLNIAILIVSVLLLSACVTLILVFNNKNGGTSNSIAIVNGINSNITNISTESDLHKDTMSEDETIEYNEFDKSDVFNYAFYDCVLLSEEQIEFLKDSMDDFLLNNSIASPKAMNYWDMDNTNYYFFDENQTLYAIDKYSGDVECISWDDL